MVCWSDHSLIQDLQLPLSGLTLFGGKSSPYLVKEKGVSRRLHVI